jgi:hypothetical protein
VIRWKADPPDVVWEKIRTETLPNPWHRRRHVIVGVLSDGCPSRAMGSGAREGLGCLLILGAGLVEGLAKPTTPHGG